MLGANKEVTPKPSLRIKEGYSKNDIVLLPSAMHKHHSELDSKDSKPRFETKATEKAYEQAVALFLGPSILFEKLEKVEISITLTNHLKE